MIRQHAAEGMHPVRRALGRGLARVARTTVLAVVAVAAAPVTMVAAAAFGYGWWRGCPPRRLAAAALWCLPMTAAWLVAAAAWPAGPGLAGTGAAGTGAAGNAGAGTDPAGTGPGSPWFRVAATPARAWAASWRLAGHGHLVAAAIAAAPPAIPLGLLAGALAWSYRIARMDSGTGGLTPRSPAAFDARQWRHQARGARALITAPGSLPLLSPGGHVVTGAVIRAVRHRAGRAAAIPYERLRAHQVVIGSTGTGKTTLLLRLWAGFMAAGLRRYTAGTGRRPLLVVLDCKGGASSRKVADRSRRVLRDAGARSTAIWPDEASLSLWTLPPDRLVTTLIDLIEHGTGGAAYYTDVMEALVELAVRAPGGPPADSAGFLARLDADWLAAAYAASGDADALAAVRSGRKAVEDVKLRFRALWRRLGPGLDGGWTFADADAWYCVLEGTAEAAVAEAQARALTDLLAYYALGGEREILLCVDEFSAVSRRLPISRLYERARSLGLAVQVSAQSWEGLAGTEDERQRVAATAEGGIWLLRTPHPEPVAALAGTLPSVDTTRRFSGAGPWRDDGQSRARPAPVLDGDLVRRLDVGQVCYVYRGGVTYLQVKRLTGQQAAIGAAAVPPPFAPAGGAASGTAGDRADAPTQPLPAARAGAVPGPALPDASEVLDEAFGPRRG